LDSFCFSDAAISSIPAKFKPCHIPWRVAVSKGRDRRRWFWIEGTVRGLPSGRKSSPGWLNGDSESSASEGSGVRFHWHLPLPFNAADSCDSSVLLLHTTRPICPNSTHPTHPQTPLSLVSIPHRRHFYLSTPAGTSLVSPAPPSSSPPLTVLLPQSPTPSASGAVLVLCARESHHQTTSAARLPLLQPSR
jgi:hypothetical protein